MLDDIVKAFVEGGIPKNKIARGKATSNWDVSNTVNFKLK